jgi:hypothetical protein
MNPPYMIGFIESMNLELPPWGESRMALTWTDLS